MTQTSMIRPAWTPATIAMMVIGFMIFWPLGLAMLAYILWGDRLDTFKRDVNQATENVRGAFKCGGSSRRDGWHQATGNAAFDDWREQELARLDEERQKLDEMRKEFDEYSRELRRAKDQAEFDEFMAARKPMPPKNSRNKRGPSVPKTDG